MDKQVSKIESPILRPHQVAEYLQVSIATVWRLVKQDGFPQPFRLGIQSTGFLRSDIDAWLQNRATLCDYPKKNLPKFPGRVGKKKAE